MREPVSLAGPHTGDAASPPANGRSHSTALSPTSPTALSPTSPTALSPTSPTALSPTSPTALSPTSPSSLRRAILVHLRQSGPTSPDGLATALRASRTGVLQQLHALEEARLVSHAAEKHGVGRPRHLYDVTPDAQELFPADYGGFAGGLLAAIKSIGGEALIEQVFVARRRQIADRVRRRLAERLSPEASLEAQVRELAVIQDEGGYLAEAIVGADGSLRLREHNCAIYHVARGSSAACEAELELFEEILGVAVKRESHIASGDRCCTYLVGEVPND